MTEDTAIHFTLFDAGELDEVVAAMAGRAAALLAGRERTAVIGIRRRGAPLADRICAKLAEAPGVTAPLRVDLDIKRYADDLSLLYPETRLSAEPRETAVELRGYTVLLVDDVLYSGHSLLAAVGHLARRLPAEIRVAVLADRGTARLPVHADIVGVHLEVAAGDIVECRVPPFEPDFGIAVIRKGAAGPSQA